MGGRITRLKTGLLQTSQHALRGTSYSARYSVIWRILRLQVGYKKPQPGSPVGIDLAEQFQATLPKTDLRRCLQLSYKKEIRQREKPKLSRLDCSFASLSLSIGMGFQGFPVSEYSAALQWPVQGRHLCNGRLHYFPWRQPLPCCRACASRSHH